MALTTRRLTAAFALCLGLAPAAATAAWTQSTLKGAAVGGAPHVAVNAEGAAVVAWASQSGVLRAGLRRAGGRFGPVRVLRHAPAGALHDPDVAVDRAGTAYVTWAEVARTAPRYRVMVATAPRAGRFGRPTVLGGAESVRRARPEVVLGPGADAFVAWRRDHTGFVLAQRLAGARFGGPRAPVGLPLPDVDWAMAPDGRLHLLWTAAGPGGPFIAATRGRLTRSFAVPAAVRRPDDPRPSFRPPPTARSSRPGSRPPTASSARRAVPSRPPRPGSASARGSPRSACPRPARTASTRASRSVRTPRPRSHGAPPTPAPSAASPGSPRAGPAARLRRPRR